MRLWFWSDGEAEESGAWLEPAPSANLGFRERQAFLIRMPAQSGWQLRIDDEPLDEPEPGRGVWRWKPGFYAGEVVAELADVSGVTAAVYFLDVAPDPTKTGRNAFGEMLDEVWRSDPALVLGSEPSTRRSGSLGPFQDPLVEFGRFRRYVPEFLRAMRGIADRPIRSLKISRDQLPLNRVRRVDRHSARSALRNPVVAAYILGTTSQSVAASPPRLDVPSVEETLDSAANRCLAALTRSLRRRSRDLARSLQAQLDGDPRAETRTLLAPRWPARIQFLLEIERRLSALLRGMPLSRVRRAEVTAAGLNAVSADPLYARAYRAGWKSLRSGVFGLDPDERVWISPTWEIYERWCFVRLGEQIRLARPDLTWQSIEKHPTGATACLKGQGNGVVIELLLQPRFPSEHPVKSHGFWSVSKLRLPDLVIAASDGAMHRYVVLDAKYRALRDSVLDGMSSAHIYQDSLRWGAERPLESLLLVPAGGGAPWLEPRSFQLENKVGILTLNPNSGLPEPVEQLLRPAEG